MNDRAPEVQPHALAGLFGALVRVPTAAVSLLFWVLLVSFVAAFVGAFVWYLVLPMAGYLWFLTRRWMSEGVPSTGGWAGASVLVLAGVVVWVVLNLPYASEVLVVQRDSGFLTLEGLWLSSNRTPGIDVGSAVAVAEAEPGLFASSDAFTEVDGILRAQGATGFATMLGLAGWISGTTGVLTANLAIAGVALLALYDLARRLMGPWWALLPVALLGLSMPMVYFSRTPFTEPLTAALLLGAAGGLLSAISTRSAGQLRLAAAMAGSAGLVRIDGALVAMGVVAGLVAAGLVAEPAGKTQRFLRRTYGQAAGICVGLVALGAGALSVQSPDYAQDLRGEFLVLMLALLGIAAGGALLMSTPFILGFSEWIDARRVLAAQLVGVGMAAAGVLLVSRPLWAEAHGTEPGTSYASQVMLIQGNAGQVVDGTRSYGEMTVSWLAWYLGWPTVLLAGVGSTALALLAVRAPKAHLVAVLTALGLSSLPYLLRPSITPDQVWAMRRLLFAAMPAVALLAAWALGRVWRARWRLARPLGLLGACVALAGPVAWWDGPLRTTVEQGGRAEQVAALCGAIPPGTNVVTARTGFNPTLLPTLRIACGAQVVEVRDPLTPDRVGRIRAAWGGGPLMVATFSPEAVRWLGLPEPLHDEPIWRWEETLYPPGRATPWRYPLYVGEAATDGRFRVVRSDGSRDCQSVSCPEYLPNSGLAGVLGEGWWEMEEWGVWSTARATLIVSHGQCTQNCRAVLRLRGPVEDTYVRVSRAGSGEVLAERGVFLDQEIIVPLDSSRDVTELELRVRPTYQPSEALGGSDARDLGVGLRGIAVVGS